MTTAPAHRFRDITPLTRIATALLVLHMAAALLAVLSGWWERDFLTDLRDNTFTDGAFVEEAMVDGDRWRLISAVTQTVAFIVAGIFVLVWTYRAGANAHALAQRPLKYSPGWAVGWYFIPIANLIKPYLALKEFWYMSKDPARAPPENGEALIVAWWLTWVVTNLFANVAGRYYLRAEDLEPMLRANALMMASDALEIPLTLLLLAVMWRLRRMQLQTHAAARVADDTDTELAPQDAVA